MLSPHIVLEIIESMLFAIDARTYLQYDCRLFFTIWTQIANKIQTLAVYNEMYFITNVPNMKSGRKKNEFATDNKYFKNDI